MDSEYHEWATFYIDGDGNHIDKLTVWWGWYNDPYTMNTYHREDGPAYIVYKNGVEAYCCYMVNNKQHRVDGPAVICTDSTVVGFGENVPFEHYYLLNKRITKEDFYTPGFIDSFILEHS